MNVPVIVPGPVLLNPGVNANNILNFAVPDNVKFYHQAIKGLDDEMKYYLSPIELRTFLDKLCQRCTLYGTDGILMVPTADEPAGENLLENYGKITMAECTARATAIFVAMTRDAQNSTMVYHFLYASVTKEAITKINLWKTAFTIVTHKDGLTFLCTIITKAQLDTIGTVEAYRKQIWQLPIKIVELTGNIQEFHCQVNTVKRALDSYRKEYPELILNLFNAYDKVEGKQFATYVMVTRFGYVAAPDTYQPRNLMQEVENLYKMRVQAGTWQLDLQK
jgi:hypothetical protein